MKAWRLAFFPVLLILASCGSQGLSGPASAPGAPDVRVSALAGSDWQAGDISTELTPVAGGYQLDVASSAAAPASSVLLELHFDPNLIAADAVQLCPQGKLSLLVSDKPGVVALGVVMPAGQALQPGALLSCTLQPAPAARHAALAVDPAQVSDLAAARDATSVTLSWSYKLKGDYDQNSEVNIADLTPLGVRLNQSTSDGDQDEYDLIVDGDGNGQVTIADLTPIGANYSKLISGYNCYTADGADIGSATSTLQGNVAYAAGQQANPQSRRTYVDALTDPLQLAERYFYVRPVLGDSSEGAPSNVVDSPLAIDFDFAVPPAGQSTIDVSLSASPSIVLLDGNGTTIEDGSPVVAYTKAGAGGNQLFLAHYTAGAWQSAAVDGNNYLSPRLVVTGDTRGVIAYDVTHSSMTLLKFDAQWQLQDAETFGTLGPPTMVDVDIDPANGDIGVAVGTPTGATGFQVIYCTNAGGGLWSTDPIVATGTDTLGGVAFGFDPNGGDPWLFYTHGTLDTSTSFILSFNLEMARQSGGNWTSTPVAYPDSPLTLDLDFDAAGNPALAFTAARDYTIPIVGTTLSMQFDGVVGSYDGATWSFTKYFPGTLGIQFGGGLPPTTVTLNLEMDLGTSWARAGEIAYAKDSGGVTLDIATFMPQSGSLTPEAHYSVGSGGTYGDTGYFTGAPGRSFSWDEHGSVHGAAYLQAQDISSDTLLSGDLSLDAALLFWRK